MVGLEEGEGYDAGEVEKNRDAHEHTGGEENSLEWSVKKETNRGGLATGAVGGTNDSSWRRRPGKGESELMVGIDIGG